MLGMYRVGYTYGGMGGRHIPRDGGRRHIPGWDTSFLASQKKRNEPKTLLPSLPEEEKRA